MRLISSFVLFDFLSFVFYIYFWYFFFLQTTINAEVYGAFAAFQPVTLVLPHATVAETYSHSFRHKNDTHGVDKVCKYNPTKCTSIPVLKKIRFGADGLGLKSLGMLFTDGSKYVFGDDRGFTSSDHDDVIFSPFDAEVKSRLEGGKAVLNGSSRESTTPFSCNDVKFYEFEFSRGETITEMQFIRSQQENTFEIREGEALQYPSQTILANSSLHDGDNLFTGVFFATSKNRHFQAHFIYSQGDMIEKEKVQAYPFPPARGYGNSIPPDLSSLSANIILNGILLSPPSSVSSPVPKCVPVHVPTPIPKPSRGLLSIPIGSGFIVGCTAEYSYAVPYIQSLTFYFLEEIETARIKKVDLLNAVLEVADVVLSTFTSGPHDTFVNWKFKGSTELEQYDWCALSAESVKGLMGQISDFMPAFPFFDLAKGKNDSYTVEFQADRLWPLDVIHPDVFSIRSESQYLAEWTVDGYTTPKKRRDFIATSQKLAFTAEYWSEIQITTIFGNTYSVAQSGVFKASKQSLVHVKEITKDDNRLKQILEGESEE